MIFSDSPFNPYPANIFCPENVACFLCLLHIQVHFRLDFCMEANTMNPDQTDPLGGVQLLIPMESYRLCEFAGGPRPLPPPPPPPTHTHTHTWIQRGDNRGGPLWFRACMLMANKVNKWIVIYKEYMRVNEV